MAVLFLNWQKRETGQFWNYFSKNGVDLIKPSIKCVNSSKTCKSMGRTLPVSPISPRKNGFDAVFWFGAISTCKSSTQMRSRSFFQTRPLVSFLVTGSRPLRSGEEAGRIRQSNRETFGQFDFSGFQVGTGTSDADHAREHRRQVPQGIVETVSALTTGPARFGWMVQAC